MLGLYNFKAALDYSSLYRSRYFWCCNTTLQKKNSIEILNLTLNKQTNFNKLCPLSYPRSVENCKPPFG